jgi:uncharacterized membrane protein YqjE
MDTLPEADASVDEHPRTLRGLLIAGREALRTRLELASLELEIYLRALLRLLVWAIAAVVCALLALAFAMTALVVALWGTHRIAALCGGSLAFAALAATCAYLGTRALRLQPGVLAGSLEQLRKDQTHGEGAA